MFVLWQGIGVEPQGIDVIGGAVANTRGIIYGQDIVAASMLDYIAFEYEYNTQTITGANNYTLGTVTSHYNIGETNLLITKDSTLPVANWNHTPFLSGASYSLDIPDAIASQTIAGVGTLPSEVIININQLAFYTGDDAKARIRMQNGFGITVATATTTFGVSVSDPTHADNLDSEETIDLQMGGNTYFFTDFAGKKSYKLKGLYDLWGIDPDEDRPVYIIPFTPSPSWGITNVAKEYFRVEFELAYGFTKFMATQLTPQIFSMPSSSVYVESVLYFTFTEFPEWYGGEIIHDPSYSAIAAAAAQAESTTTTDLPPGTTTEGVIPGFEFLSTLLAIPPLYALYRKRRN
ncbi:MAG: Heimdall-CTERM domain-containing surface protein [Promethearchaeota archaeon]